MFLVFWLVCYIIVCSQDHKPLDKKANRVGTYTAVLNPNTVVTCRVCLTTFYSSNVIHSITTLGILFLLKRFVSEQNLKTVKSKEIFALIFQNITIGVFHLKHPTTRNKTTYFILTLTINVILLFEKFTEFISKSFEVHICDKGIFISEQNLF